MFLLSFFFRFQPPVSTIRVQQNNFTHRIPPPDGKVLHLHCFAIDIERQLRSPWHFTYLCHKRGSELWGLRRGMIYCLQGGPTTSDIWVEITPIISGEIKTVSHLFIGPFIGAVYIPPFITGSVRGPPCTLQFNSHSRDYIAMFHFRIPPASMDSMFQLLTVDASEIRDQLTS